MKGVYLEKVSILHPVHLLLEPEEDARAVEVRAVAESVENQQKMRLVTNLVLHEVIEPHGNQQRGNDHNVQLYVNRASRQVAEPAAQGDEQVEQQNGQRRGGV